MIGVRVSMISVEALKDVGRGNVLIQAGVDSLSSLTYLIDHG